MGVGRDTAFLSLLGPIAPKKLREIAPGFADEQDSAHVPRRSLLLWERRKARCSSA